MANETSTLQVNMPDVDQRPAVAKPQLPESFGKYPPVQENYSIDSAAAVLLTLGKAHSGVILSNLNEVQIGQLVRGAEMLRTAERGMRTKSLRAFVEAMSSCVSCWKVRLVKSVLPVCSVVRRR